MKFARDGMNIVVSIPVFNFDFYNFVVAVL